MPPLIPHETGEPIDPQDLWMLDVSALIAAAMLVLAALAGVFALAERQGCAEVVAAGPLGGTVWLLCGNSR